MLQENIYIKKALDFAKNCACNNQLVLSFGGIHSDLEALYWSNRAISF